MLRQVLEAIYRYCRNRLDTTGANHEFFFAGFQTHNTPVLLGVRDRAELATEKYIAVSPLLEGVVIVRLNPDYVEE